MTAGYSGTPLIKKLGIKPGQRIAIIGGPPDYWDLLGPLPEGVQVVEEATGPLDLLHLFFTNQADMRAGLAGYARAIAPDGMIWVSWPKKASGVQSDLSENEVREAALALGLVDVKVAAVDATWSGLKLVIPVRDRDRGG